MNPLAKLSLFVVGLLAVFGAGLGLGAVTGTADDSPPPVHVEHTP